MNELDELEEYWGVGVVDACAKHAHEVNRAYCEALGDVTQVPWDDAPEWQRASAIVGVRGILSNVTSTPADQHELWMQFKLKDGWVCGPIKDPALKTHPCMVPYAELPPEQRAKDHLFRAAVVGMAETLKAAAAAS